MEPPDAWWANGERVPVEDRQGNTRRVFLRSEGSGPTLTLLHGFPSSSWDWAPLLESLEGCSILAPDLLGFGNADKPSDHAYSLDEQLAIVEQLWQREEVERTWILAHDYSVSIVQALLARYPEAWEGPEIEAVTLLNGGLFYTAQDRKLVQDLLRVRLLGDLIARLMPRRIFLREFGDVFAEGHRPPEDELLEHWRIVKHRGGRGAIAGLVGYLDERREHEDRWTRALAEAPVPVRYVWGLQDPISGPSIAQAIRDRLEDPDLVELPDVGHYPQIEAPEAVREHALLPGD